MGLNKRNDGIDRNFKRRHYLFRDIYTENHKHRKRDHSTLIRSTSSSASDAISLTDNTQRDRTALCGDERILIVDSGRIGDAVVKPHKVITRLRFRIRAEQTRQCDQRHEQVHGDEQHRN